MDSIQNLITKYEHFLEHLENSIAYIEENPSWGWDPVIASANPQIVALEGSAVVVEGILSDLRTLAI